MAENAPPFPTSTKSKRHSLNIGSPGPRPLHLVSGSVLSSPSHSPSRSPALHNSGSNSPVLGTFYHYAGPLSPIGSSSVKNGRRQSSISYLPSKDRSMSFPSPLSPTGFSREIALMSGNSDVAGSSGIEMEGSRVSIGTTSAITLGTLKGRPPATLAEKHAELLHFIAQKESKCLELRSQLETYEAELLQLKHKWERIVNRGFEKSSSSSFPSPSTPPSSTALPSHLYPSSLTTNAPSSSSGVVLECIKEGVQGMGRAITAGLGSIAHVGIPEGNSSVSSSTGMLAATCNGRKSSKFPVPLRLGCGNNYGHESQSSSSTCASVTTVPSSSSTSATSFMLEHGATQLLSPSFTSTIDKVLDECDEFGDFEKAPTNELAKHEENPEQVLMVHDTGATPTMSPNPHFRRRSWMKVEGKDPTCDTSGSNFWDDSWMTSGVSITTIDGMDDFTDPGSQTRLSSSSPVTHTVQPVPTKSPKIKTPSLPGVSPIPGFASSSMSMNGPTPQSMNGWLGSVSKKWGEIRESQTFTKSQKRASILLSDVSQSVVSALVPPSSLSASPRSVTALKFPLENLFVINAFHDPPSHSHSINVESTITKKNTSVSASLMDDFDIAGLDEALQLRIGSPVLVPDAASKNTLNPSRRLEVRVGLVDMDNVPGESSVDDEVWNW